MNTQNEIAVTAEAAEEGKVVKMDPTLNSIQKERDEAAAVRARIQAEREEARRIREKRHLLGEVLNMQADVEKRLEAVKAQKKLLKELRNDLRGAADDTDLTADDLRGLLKRGYEAYNTKDHAKAGFEDALTGVIARTLGMRPEDIFLTRAA